MSQLPPSTRTVLSTVVPGSSLSSRVAKGVAALAVAGGLLFTPVVGAIAAPFSADGAAEQVAAAQDASGQSIADFALQFQGYPYVWAGNTPAGFDCSGFTQYVILNTVGIDIGHGTAGQMNYGAWVDWGAWEPGDLVYFAGTWDAGISHTGVYIGDGMFIHAENESTGVTISSLYSDYYAGHYYGAIRVR
jgi:cell wall-associated NlpC family hydrolase